MVTLTEIRLPNQRWQIYPQKPELARQLAEAVALPPILAQVLIDRGIETVEDARGFLDPDSIALPSPMDEFPDLKISVEILQRAIATGDKIAICGDYDADGMTSTALLLRGLRQLGANVDYAIPSRMQEGYGINDRIVREFHSEGVKIILTVDNGIAAQKPIALARELGMDAIVTDHHEVPEELPPATAILNPKLIREDSPYRGVAGVGVAYILAISLAQAIGKAQECITPLRELLTLGTIADLAPLTGVNRRWVKWGLRQLPASQLAGVQALIQVSGASSSNSNKGKAMKPDEIGFRLGPRINAIGRIGDPQIVIELLTTDDAGIALGRAMQCEQINQQRQQMCEAIEGEAIAAIESSDIDLLRDRVLVVVQPEWHHGVIGIVASRLVERYGVPVFIGTYEDGAGQHIRGSARGIPEFHVFEALQHCDALLGKYGGHRAAGGFSLSAENLPQFRQGLSEFANQCLEPHHLKPALAIDTLVEFDRIDLELYREIDRLHPCGIENPSPIFWTPHVEVVEQRIVGKGHLKLTLQTEARQSGDDAEISLPSRLKAIAWRWGDYFPLPRYVDIAYKLRENTWNGNTSVELELVGVRLPGSREQGTGNGEWGMGNGGGREKSIHSQPVRVEDAVNRVSTNQDAINRVSTSSDRFSRNADSQPVRVEDAVNRVSTNQDAINRVSTSSDRFSRNADSQPVRVEDAIYRVSTNQDAINRVSTNPLTPHSSPLTPHSSPLTPHSSPTLPLLIPEAPPVERQPEWLTGMPLNLLLPKLTGRVLLYGAGRPTVADVGCEIEYRFPQQPCETFLLWTLPPSGTHLQWLLAKGAPRRVYLYSQLPPLLSPAQLRSRLEKQVKGSSDRPLNLLKLGQELWVAPSTLLAALRELGYACAEFPPTESVDRELERLYRWYAFPPERLARIDWGRSLH